MMWPKSVQFIVAYTAKILAEYNENWPNFKTAIALNTQLMLLLLLLLLLAVMPNRPE